MSSANTRFSVYVGNLDERVSDRVLYDILIQAGRVVDLHIPRDKETDRPKGFAFAEYETEEIAQYAVRLFSGVVTLYNRTLKFAISGQDRPSPNVPSTVTPPVKFSNKLRSPPVPFNNMEISPNSVSSLTPLSPAGNYPSVPTPTGVNNRPDEYGLYLNGNNYEYSRRVIGQTLDTISRSRSRRNDMSNPISYPS